MCMYQVDVDGDSGALGRYVLIFNDSAEAVAEAQKRFKKDFPKAVVLNTAVTTLDDRLDQPCRKVNKL